MRLLNGSNLATIRYFSEVAANLHQILYPPQQQPVTKSAPVPHKVRPTQAKHIPSEQPNIIEDYYVNIPTIFQHNFHMYPSGPHIILPDVTVPPSRVRPAQLTKMEMGWPSSNLISSCTKNPVPNFQFPVQFLQVREANTVTYQIFGVAQDYRHLVKGLDRKFWERSFVNEMGQLSQGIRTVKGEKTVIFIAKTQVPKDKKVAYGKIVYKLKPENRGKNEPD